MTFVSSRLRPFGTTIFAEMTALAREHDAINLSQGFPDTDGPDALLDAAARALRDHDNQYAPLPGLPSLRAAIAGRWHTSGNRQPDPDTEITVTAGCTEAIAATLLGLLEPGDEVILFEPFYDSYRACVAMADAVPRFVQLRPGPDGRFGFDPAELDAVVTPKTRAILLNTPHNPTGTVFSESQLGAVARACLDHDLIAISDEVYEHLVLDDDRAHVSIAGLPGMADRTVTLSSLGKTYSVTGWKIGWAIAPPSLTRAVRAAHQFLTYAIATPLQHAAAVALTDESCLDWIADLRARLRANRDTLCSGLAELGFVPSVPDAGYFVMADHTRVSAAKSLEGDVALVRAMTAEARVAAIPPSAFCVDADLCRSQVRFAFCKSAPVVSAAIERLGDWIDRPERSRAAAEHEERPDARN
jgi:N-succinyldiaminopimelate aminotransferase